MQVTIFQLNCISTQGEEFSQELERQNYCIYYRLKDWKGTVNTKVFSDQYFEI